MRRVGFGSVAVLLLSALPASAQRLPTIVTPEHYDLAFVIDLAHARFHGTADIRVRVAEPTMRVVINAVELRFHEATVGDGAAAQRAAVTFDEPNQTATLMLARPLARGETAIHVAFTGILNDELRGLYLSRANGRNYAVTQFESTDARRAFPCFDEPAFKATFAVKVTIDRGDTAISNGRVVSDTAGPGPNQHTVVFATSPKMSSYLVAIAVGDFECVTAAADGVPIRVCTTPDKTRLTGLALEAAQHILEFYDAYYAIKYPFGKLDIVAVPDFAAGAMENTAAIFYRESDLLADPESASVEVRKRIDVVLAHEMAHQWFGDLVTMQWWDDIWLNEGFATWMETKPVAAAHPDWNIAVDEALATEQAMELDSLQATRPIHVDVRTPAQIDEAFDAITYQKGASVLRMVERYIGADTFQRGVNAYLQAHAYGNATSEDFWKAVAAASHAPVDRILPTFVNQPGVPLISVTRACPRNETRVTFAQQRLVVGAGDGSGGAAVWQVPVCFEPATLKRAPNPEPAACVILAEPRHEYSVFDAGCAPWVFANVDARGYYRTEYPPEMLRAMAPHVEAQLTAAERLSLLGDEWAMVRAGRHSVEDYLALASGYTGEHASGVLKELTARLRFIHEYLTGSDIRSRVEALTRSLLRPVVDELGFAVGAPEPDDRRALRATAVEALGTIADDAAVVARARAMVDRLLAGGTSIDPTLAGAIVRVAAAHGDAALFDRLAAAGDRASSPEDRYRFLYALGDFRDPALVDRGLRRAISSGMRSQDAAQYLAQFFRNPAARGRAWSFVTKHWTALEPKLTIFGADTELVSSLSAFCDARSRDAIQTFFARHPLPGAVRTLQQTLERIDNCIAMRDRR